MKCCYYADTHVGKVRRKNEDAFLLKEVWENTYVLSVVVDGVGGYPGGGIASYLACRCIYEHVANATVDEANKVADVLKAAVVYANNTIHSQHVNPMYDGMSCVLTAALIDIETGQVDVCHVGDTRLYVLNGEKLTKITSDHSIVGQMEESGQITELEAMEHPRRNIITRSVGKMNLQFDTDYIQTHSFALTSPSTLLFCTDGLYDMITSEHITNVLKEPLAVEERVNDLICKALDAGGKDNIAIILAELT